jgi:hypothetical protein
MSEEPGTAPAALGGDADATALAASPALTRPEASAQANGDPAPAAAETAEAQDEPNRLPAEERRTWGFRLMIALLAVLIAGVLAAGIVELRRSGVSPLISAIVIGFFALLAGARVWLMALGYGWKESGPEPGTPIPAEVRKSRSWRGGLVFWAVFNILATIAAISFGVSGDWANFSDFGGGAVLSWIGFAIAASGKVPSRDFRF